ncbi:hypothetical protein NP493_444g02041 [Ridgeia piscesae]|uniref:Mind bomb SH3 repeat domain-containing protein n=1 Tax=Ridgeia piscesae TaxID=27915 RepID=A0AAD9NTT0_RIDPI|nr:hypothetical protein NP493_444g02041 [Ridgeia piscesae]
MSCERICVFWLGTAEVEELTKLHDFLETLQSSVGNDNNDDNDGEMFVKGERVRVEVDASKASRLQEGHGGWNKKMKKYLGKVGIVKEKHLTNVVVQFPDGDWWAYNPALLQRCEDEPDQGKERDGSFQRYDIVVVDSNKDKVMSLQEGHGGWKASLVSVSCYI